MMLRLLAASLRRRGRQFLLLGAAVAVAAAAVAALTGFAARAGSGLGGDLSAFGPNLTVRPQVGTAVGLPAAAAAVVRSLDGVEGAAAVARPDAGALAARLPAGSPLAAPLAAAAQLGLPVIAAEQSWLGLHPGWRLEGAWPGGDDTAGSGAVAGARAAGELARTLPQWRPAGVLVTGGAEERALVVPLAALPGTAAEVVEARVAVDRLDAVAEQVESRVPGVEARPFLAVSSAESQLVRRVLWLLAAAALLTCLLALVTVAAATTALVVERRREVGLLLSLGLTGRRVSLLFAAEFLAAALLAALVGEVLGELAAARLAAGILQPGTGGPVFGWGLPAAALAATGVVAAAMTLALGRLQRIDPARVLRGE